jgi:hypothetical protein
MPILPGVKRKRCYNSRRVQCANEDSTLDLLLYKLILRLAYPLNLEHNFKFFSKQTIQSPLAL